MEYDYKYKKIYQFLSALILFLSWVGMGWSIFRILRGFNDPSDSYFYNLSFIDKGLLLFLGPLFVFAGIVFFLFSVVILFRKTFLDK
jgi:hypothetical protein